MLETTLTEVQAEPPTVTPAPARKPVPVIVIAVPPLVRPLVGLTELSVGAGSRYVNALVSVTV